MTGNPEIVFICIILLVNVLSASSPSYAGAAKPHGDWCFGAFLAEESN